jgi:hypothetical protein
MNGKYTDPKTQNKDAMLGSFWGSLGAAPATSRKTARRALQSAGAMPIAGKGLRKAASMGVKGKKKKKTDGPY